MGKIDEAVLDWLLDDDKVGCVACNANGEHPWHAAHVLVWQVGDVWVPSCSDRVLSWWDGRGEGERMRTDAGAPTQWIRPLEVK